MTETQTQTLLILNEELDYDQCVDIMNHGMSGGVSGFIYSSELFDKFHAHEEEIMNELNQYCDDNYGQGALDYIAEQLSYDDKFWTMQELIEYAVWMYVELKACEFVSSFDDEWV